MSKNNVLEALRAILKRSNDAVIDQLCQGQIDQLEKQDAEHKAEIQQLKDQVSYYRAKLGE